MIRVVDMTVRAGGFRLEGVGFDVPTGSHAVLMGRTGAGKTTILEAICGLKPVDRGGIALDGRDVTRLKPAERNIGYVPQDNALFSTITVREHLAFGPTVRGWRRNAIRSRVDELAALLGIGHLLDRRPQGLSGGEAQRVAIGRALGARPSVLCLDEPLNALDDATREEIAALFKAIRAHSPVTTLHITHSLDEARRLADCVLLLEGGRVQRRDVASLDPAKP